MTVQVSKRMVRWMLIGAVVSPLAVTGLNVYYTNSVDQRAKVRTEQAQKRAQQQADRRWCQLFDLYVDPAQPPPTTERGKQQREEFLILYRALGCENK